MNISNSQLVQSFEDSRNVSENYLSYISRQEDEQDDKTVSIVISLNDVAQEVKKSGKVSALAAQESLQSHNTIFSGLAAISKTQNYLMKLVVDLKQNGDTGTSGNILGSMVEGAITASTTALAVTGGTAAPYLLPIAAAGAAISGLTEAVSQHDKENASQAELNHPNSLVRQALDAASDAQKFATAIDYSLNPAPNPLMNGPGAVQTGAIYQDLPFIQTPREAFSVVAAINEANDYLESTGQIAPRTNLYEGFDTDYYDTSDINNLMRYDFINGFIDQEPQSVQTLTEYQLIDRIPEQPQQTINFNLQNDFKGNWQDRRQLEDVGESLAKQIMDKLNSGGMLYSNNW